VADSGGSPSMTLLKRLARTRTGNYDYMQSWRNSLRIKVNVWRTARYRRKRIGHRAAKNELRETQAWCAAKADLARPKECLRDERLKPVLLANSRIEAVDDVRRSRRLYRSRLIAGDQALETVIAAGRLIAYSPDFNLACGMSEAETKGYFDVNNLPPWDTWVALLDAPNAKHFEVSLIAWVPPVFVPLVQAGIDVIPEQCVLWLEDCPAPLQRLWRKVVTREQDEPRLLRLRQAS
jgi:hypothetical protein